MRRAEPRWRPRLRPNPLFPVCTPKQEKLEKFMRRATKLDIDQMFNELQATSKEIGFVPAWVAIFAGLNVASDQVMQELHIRELKRRVRSNTAKLAPRRKLAKCQDVLRQWARTYRLDNEKLGPLANRAHQALIGLQGDGLSAPESGFPELAQIISHYGDVPSRRTIERWLKDVTS